MVGWNTGRGSPTRVQRDQARGYESSRGADTRTTRYARRPSALQHRRRRPGDRYLSRQRASREALAACEQRDQHGRRLDEVPVGCVRRAEFAVDGGTDRLERRHAAERGSVSDLLAIALHGLPGDRERRTRANVLWRQRGLGAERTGRTARLEMAVLG